MSTELVAVQTAVAEFDKVAAGLKDLQDRFGGVLYDVTTTRGMDAAREARAAVRAPRFEVERVRKAAKAPILALGKSIDDRAKEITSAILAIEEPIDRQVKAEEERKEAEKQARIAAEMKRVAVLQERVAELRGNQRLSPASGSVLVAQHIADLERIPVDESFGEFLQQAEDAKAAGLARLREIHAAAVSHEAEQERIRQERAELERLRAEQSAREAAERQRQAEENRRQQEIRDAEEAERRARIAAEEAALIARKAELDRQELEAKQAREAEAARVEAVRQAIVPPPAPPAEVKIERPTDAEIALCVAVAYGVSTITVDTWLRTYGQSERAAA